MVATTLEIFEADLAKCATQSDILRLLEPYLVLAPTDDVNTLIEYVGPLLTIAIRVINSAMISEALVVPYRLLQVTTNQLFQYLCNLRVSPGTSAQDVWDNYKLQVDQSVSDVEQLLTQLFSNVNIRL